MSLPSATGCTASGTSLTIGTLSGATALLAGMVTSWAAQSGVNGGAIVSGGTLYDGSGTHLYTAVPLTGGTGSGAQASVQVTGGVVTSVTITTIGTGYLTGDQLSAAVANLGNNGGSGFVYGVTGANPVTPPITLVTNTSGGTGSGGVWTTSAATGIGAGGTTVTFELASPPINMADFPNLPIVPDTSAAVIPQPGTVIGAVPPLPLPITGGGQASYPIG